MSEVIHQCELCFVFFDAQGLKLNPQPGIERGFFVPVLFRCTACLTKPDVAQPAPSKPALAPTKRSAMAKCKAPLPQAESHRGCPPEREFGPTHLDFVQSAEASNKEEAVLALFNRTFDGVASDWCTGIDILRQCGVKASNSCMGRLRKRLGNDLDIDSRVIPGGHANEWEYRLCRREESLRLKRLRDKNSKESL